MLHQHLPFSIDPTSNSSFGITSRLVKISKVTSNNNSKGFGDFWVGEQREVTDLEVGEHSATQGWPSRIKSDSIQIKAFSEKIDEFSNPIMTSLDRPDNTHKMNVTKPDNLQKGDHEEAWTWITLYKHECPHQLENCPTTHDHISFGRTLLNSTMRPRRMKKNFFVWQSHNNWSGYKLRTTASAAHTSVKEPMLGTWRPALCLKFRRKSYRLAYGLYETGLEHKQNKQF